MLFSLVERSAAVLRSTQAGDFVLLQGEFVVVGDLLVNGDRLLGVDHDLLLRLYGDDFSVAVWLRKEDFKTFRRRTFRVT